MIVTNPPCYDTNVLVYGLLNPSFNDVPAANADPNDLAGGEWYSYVPNDYNITNLTSAEQFGLLWTNFYVVNVPGNSGYAGANGYYDAPADTEKVGGAVYLYQNAGDINVIGSGLGSIATPSIATPPGGADRETFDLLSVNLANTENEISGNQIQIIGYTNNGAGGPMAAYTNNVTLLLTNYTPVI